ncbi:MAG: DUF1272 domain-containing protein [Thermoplasmata archaeon]|nr:DUF1272 domain-containing protein [Thermoplasmata archaeon]
MALEMKTTCERCSSPRGVQSAAFICSFECTFCPTCAEALNRVCPNCSGELVPRPRRGTA